MKKSNAWNTVSVIVCIFLLPIAWTLPTKPLHVIHVEHHQETTRDTLCVITKIKLPECKEVTIGTKDTINPKWVIVSDSGKINDYALVVQGEVINL